MAGSRCPGRVRGAPTRGSAPTGRRTTRWRCGRRHLARPRTRRPSPHVGLEVGRGPRHRRGVDDQPAVRREQAPIRASPGSTRRANSYVASDVRASATKRRNSWCLAASPPTGPNGLPPGGHVVKRPGPGPGVTGQSASTTGWWIVFQFMPPVGIGSRGCRCSGSRETPAPGSRHDAFYTIAQNIGKPRTADPDRRHELEDDPPARWVLADWPSHRDRVPVASPPVSHLAQPVRSRRRARRQAPRVPPLRRRCPARRMRRYELALPRRSGRRRGSVLSRRTAGWRRRRDGGEDPGRLPGLTCGARPPSSRPRKVSRPHRQRVVLRPVGALPRVGAPRTRPGHRAGRPSPRRRGTVDVHLDRG